MVTRWLTRTHIHTHTCIIIALSHTHTQDGTLYHFDPRACESDVLEKTGKKIDDIKNPQHVLFLGTEKKGQLFVAGLGMCVWYMCVFALCMYVCVYEHVLFLGTEKK